MGFDPNTGEWIDTSDPFYQPSGGGALENFLSMITDSLRGNDMFGFREKYDVEPAYTPDYSYERPNTQPQTGDFSSNFWRSAYGGEAEGVYGRPRDPNDYEAPNQTILDNPELGPVRMAGEAGRPNPFEGIDFDSIQAGLQQQLDMVREGRDQAIRKSGGAAAAQYNRAIARITDEIARTEAMRVNTADVTRRFQKTFAEGQDASIDRAGESVRSLRDKFGDGQRLPGTEKVPSGELASTLQEVSRSDVPLGESAAALEAIETEILDSDSQDLKIDKLTEATAKVTEAAIAEAKATGNFHLENEQEQLDLKLQDKIAGLLRDKKEAEAARAAAASAARSAAKQAYNTVEGLNFGQDGFIAYTTNQLGLEFSQRGQINPNQEEMFGGILGSFWDAGVRDAATARTMMRSADQFDLVFGDGAWGALAPQIGDQREMVRWGSLIGEGMDLMIETDQAYVDRYVNVNPNIYEENSWDRYNAVYEQNRRNQFQTGSDLYDTIFEDQSEQIPGAGAYGSTGQRRGGAYVDRGR